MKGNIKRHLFLGIFLILTALLFIQGSLNAQGPFYGPLYFPGYYIIPSLYPFSPAYPSIYTGYTPAPVLSFYNPLYVPPVPVTPPSYTASPVSPIPTASISAIAPLVPITPISTITAVIIADIAINTGNPEVAAVLNLIIQDPTLADNPFLLDAIINTGNPDVASALAWLVTVI